MMKSRSAFAFGISCLVAWGGAFTGTVEAQGRPDGLWVNSYAADHLVRLDAGGVPQAPRRHGREAGAIAVAPDGRVYSIAQATDELWVYDATGVLVATQPTAAGPWGVAVDRDGNVWVGCATAGVLEKRDHAGALLSVHRTEVGIRGMVGDWLGNLWVASATTDEVLRYDLSGRLHARIFAGDDPRYLAVSHEGVLYAVYYQECMVRMIGLLDDRVWKEEGLPTWPGDVAVDNEAQVWVALGGLDAVRRLDRTLTYSVDFPVGVEPVGVSADCRGSIWIANYETGSLNAYRPDGSPMPRVSIGGKPFAPGDMSGAHALVNLDPHGDADGDGFENRTEWIGGSDLLSALDVPCTLTATRNGPFIDLDWHEPHHTRTWVCFFLTYTPRPGQSLEIISRGIDARLFPSNLLDPIALVSLTVPEPRLFESFQGFSDANGRFHGRLHLPYALPQFEIAAFSMDLEVLPTFVRTMHPAIAMP